VALPGIHGATTIWERWTGWTEETGFFDPAMNSFNHYSLGSVGEWLYRHVAGIEFDPDVPGFEPTRRSSQPQVVIRAPGEISNADARAIARSSNGVAPSATPCSLMGTRLPMGEQPNRPWPWAPLPTTPARPSGCLRRSPSGTAREFQSSS
jgi:hypothetical protein